MYGLDIQLMKIIALFLIISSIYILVSPKSVSKSIKLANFYKEGPFIFVTKLHIGSGYGQVDVDYIKGDQIASQQFYNDLSIGIINHTAFDKFSTASKCEEKMQLLYQRENFNFRQERQGRKHTKILNLPQEALWYFYIFSCSDNLNKLSDSSQQIKFSFSVLNNGSHFGQNQITLYGYIAIIIIWGILMFKFAIPIGSLISLQNPSTLKITIFGGLIVLGAAYLYKLFYLVLYNSNGTGIQALQYIYLLLKNGGEAIITTVIVSVAWGWSIVHLNSNQSYIIIGVFTGIANVISLILSTLTEENQQTFHHYDTIPGGIVLILRIVLFLVFMAGIVTSLKQTAGKTVYFIKKFAFLGGIYLLSWPATVLIVELTLPNYMHKEVITFVEETVHICASTFICHMISNPESSYRKISLHEDDNPLQMPEYRKK